MTLLIWVTATLVAVLVAVLVGYLGMTAIMLTQARRDLEKIAAALERAADHGEPIRVTIEGIDAWTSRLAERGRRIARPASANQD